MAERHSIPIADRLNSDFSHLEDLENMETAEISQGKIILLSRKHSEIAIQLVGTLTLCLRTN